MPRRNRRERQPDDEDEAARTPLPPETVLGAPAGWVARAIQPFAAQKRYTCPVCHRPVEPGVGHIVAWPEDGESQRRHFHTHCWRLASRTGRIPT